MVAEGFNIAAISPRELSHIGVTLGPGSFTGLRVGLSFAKGLASGLGLKLAGIGTLEALNHHPDLAGKRVLSAIDGGRGRIYVLANDGPPDVFDPASPPETDVLTGPAAALLSTYYPCTDVFNQAWPSLEAIHALTLAPGHDDVTPLYMRDADAVVSTRGIISLQGSAA